ncbi:MAG TPA: hypothetical protein ENK57_10370 [Polyangiaceae bacterium]|nr:hypothetical protein [Polyangiaceae bacterium]
MICRHVAVILALAVVVGCGSDAATFGEGGAPAGMSSAVVGVSFDAPLEGQVDRLQIVVTADGEALLDEAVDTDGATPIEIEVPALEPGTRLQARVVAFRGAEEVLRQVEMTEVMLGRTLLLAMRLNDECVPATAHRDVSCSNSTCRQGVCASPFVDPRDLADYRADWATPPSGSCGVVDAGEPIAVLGAEGDTFVPLQDGQILRPYRGLQGGMHFFLAVEASGIDDQSAVTHYFDKILATGRESSVLSVAKPYVAESDGCHRLNLAYVLPPLEVVGETMRLGVNVSDLTGNTGHGHVDVVVGEPIEAEH